MRGEAIGRAARHRGTIQLNTTQAGTLNDIGITVELPPDVFFVTQ
jgi:hypothetical protein